MELCITLGHNSSCILLDKGKIICGYENERLSKIKSDSQFPKLAIEKCLEYTNNSEINELFISHWAVDAELSSIFNKHYDPFYISKRFPKAKIFTLSKEFTHHDAHYYSAKCFAQNFDKDYTIVADGFGNFGETFSIYHEGQLIRRSHGYKSSLGLLYQYATAYLELKMNQDEYKLLGYEAYINDYLDINEINNLDREVLRWSMIILDQILYTLPEKNYDPMYNLDSLTALRLDYYERFDNLLSKLKYKESIFGERAIISYFVQKITEKVLKNIIALYNMKKVLLTGGLFLNVKLNNEISKLVNKICVFPLCGDQGAALGIYYKKYKNTKINTLNIGLRALNIDKLDSKIFLIKAEEVNGFVFNALEDNKIINIICGAMEFGPRALCNTSTIALPTLKNVVYINNLNDRDTIMPMAPVITNVKKYFHKKKIKKIYKSLNYMVITTDFDVKVDKYIRGIAHNVYNTGKYTARPQVITENHILYPVVKHYGILINTSFNFHGQPIVFDEDDINKAYRYQRKSDYQHRVLTIVVI